MKLLLGLTMICCLQVAVASDMRLKVITLKYKTAQEIIPLLEPLMPADSHISGQGNKLIVNTTTHNLTEIRYLLHQLDVAPVSMQISIRQGSPLDSPQALHTNQVMQTFQTPNYNNVKAMQSVQVLAGQPAYVETAYEKPMITDANFGDWNINNIERLKQRQFDRKSFSKTNELNRYQEQGVFGGFSMQYRPLKTGFWLVPTVHGGRVQIKIFRQRQELSRFGQDTVNTQVAQTTMMVPWGQWVKVSANENDIPIDKQAFNYQVGSQYQQSSNIYIKVEKIR